MLWLWCWQSHMKKTIIHLKVLHFLIHSVEWQWDKVQWVEKLDDEVHPFWTMLNMLQSPHFECLVQKQHQTFSWKVSRDHYKSKFILDSFLFPCIYSEIFKMPGHQHWFFHMVTCCEIYAGVGCISWLQVWVLLIFLHSFFESALL